MTTDEGVLAAIRHSCDAELARGLAMSPVSPERYGRCQFATRILNILDGRVEVRNFSDAFLTDWGDPDGPHPVGIVRAEPTPETP